MQTDCLELDYGVVNALTGGAQGLSAALHADLRRFVSDVSSATKLWAVLVDSFAEPSCVVRAVRPSEVLESVSAVASRSNAGLVVLLVHTDCP